MRRDRHEFVARFDRVLSFAIKARIVDRICRTASQFFRESEILRTICMIGGE